MKKLYIVPIFFLLFGCSSSLILKRNYSFHDSKYRNINLTFRGDSTFLLINSASDLSFSMIGKWTFISEYKLVLNDSSDFSSTKIVSPGPGEKIDAYKAFDDRRYIFPIPQNDTIKFDKRFRSFSLRKYNFKANP